MKVSSLLSEVGVGRVRFLPVSLESLNSSFISFMIWKYNGCRFDKTRVILCTAWKISSFIEVFWPNNDCSLFLIVQQLSTNTVVTFAS